MQLGGALELSIAGILSGVISQLMLYLLNYSSLSSFIMLCCILFYSIIFVLTESLISNDVQEQLGQREWPTPRKPQRTQVGFIPTQSPVNMLE